jgi:Uma2 family endonuclease
MAAITQATVEKPIHYPESDGKPMAETDVHIDALIYLRETLKAYFTAEPRVYVAGNMLLYYEEGNPAACVAPDVFVVRGVTKQERRTYKLWEEEQVPTVVFEITSRSTRLEDLDTKRFLYARLGVQEYFLYDPLDEYLRPPLQGYRLHDGEYERMAGEPDVGLVSEALGLALMLENGRLRVVHPETRERLLTPAEAYTARRVAEARVLVVETRVLEEAAQRQAAENRALQEAAQRQAAEARVAHAEAELARLRAEMARLREGE